MSYLFSSIKILAGEHAAIITVFVLPQRESYKSLVNFESLEGLQFGCINGNDVLLLWAFGVLGLFCLIIRIVIIYFYNLNYYNYYCFR